MRKPTSVAHLIQMVIKNKEFTKAILLEKPLQKVLMKKELRGVVIENVIKLMVEVVMLTKHMKKVVNRER